MYFQYAKESKPSWWRYAITLTATVFAYLVLGSLPVSLAIWYQNRQGFPVDVVSFAQTYNPEFIGIGKNPGLAMLLFPAVAGFFTLWFFIRWLHGRNTGQMASAYGKLRWKRLLYAAGFWLLLLVFAEILTALLMPQNYSYHFNARLFFPLLGIALVMIPLQTWFEELLFRSYLMQGMGLLFNSRLAALLITSIAFGLLHITNPEVRLFGLASTMPYYIGFGIFAGLLVVMDNGIEMACGIHAVSNIYSAVFVSYESSVLQTPSIWHIEQLHPWLMNLFFLLAATVFILVSHKKFQWRNWKKLWQPISS